MLELIDEAGRLELDNAIVSVLGKKPSSGDARSIADFSRQALVLGRANRWDEAAETLRTGLDEVPGRPELFGLLGWVYKSMRPRKTADARLAFARSVELGVRDADTYLQWAFLEQDEGDWAKAAEIAELGLEFKGLDKDPRLLQTAGYARSRLGRSLRGSFLEDRADQELRLADGLLRRALAEARSVGVSADSLSRCYRSYVINAELLNDRAQVCSRLLSWLREQPSSEYALAEARRQSSLCPEVRVEMLSHDAAKT